MDQPTGLPRYEIRVRGRLGETLLAALPDLRAQAQGSETVLTGTLPDQAALFGVLDRIKVLGLRAARSPPPTAKRHDRRGSAESNGDGSSCRTGD